MPNKFSLGPFVPLFALLLALALESKASPPPTEPEKPALDQSPSLRVPLELQRQVRWPLDENFVSGIRTKSTDGSQDFQVVRAVDVSQLDHPRRLRVPRDPNEPSPGQPSFAVWQKPFPDPALAATDRIASVVDENVFTDLRMVSGRDAERLNVEGVVIGRVKLKEYDPVEVVHFLVASGIVDANLHVQASISGSHSSSANGDWFSLHSDDPYWTSRATIVRYDFGIHVETDGTIRLINAKHVGRLPAKDNEPAGAPQSPTTRP